MAVNIKTPVVVENITLMCLRILQKLIKPPAPTSKKNKVSLASANFWLSEVLPTFRVFLPEVLVNVSLSVVKFCQYSLCIV